jgi:hypothetical protein
VYPVRALALVASAVAPAAAAVVGLLVGFSVRALLRLLIANRTQSWPVGIFRGLVALFYAALAVGFVSLAGAALRWDRPQIIAGSAALALLTVPTLWRGIRRTPPARPSLVGLLLSAIVFLLAVLGATVALVHAGFVELVGERPLLLVMIRAATIESTYFPLVDASGQPVRHAYQLVLTAGGLTGL